MSEESFQNYLEKNHPFLVFYAVLGGKLKRNILIIKRFCPYFNYNFPLYS